MKKLFISLLLSIVCFHLSAQNISNPYASIGKKAPKVATVTDGEYEEFFRKDSLVQIGTTVMNRYTGEVAFFEEDNLEKFKQFTEHSEKNFRFLSVDPITSKYPMLTPYQFASNRPIDGIDIDGLEYATFTIFVQYGKVKDITVAKDYELAAKNTLGPGVQYNYAYLDKDGKIESFDAKPLVTNMYGLYQGDKNPMLPQKGGDPNKLEADYSLDPICEEDAAAMKHDLAFDALNPAQAGLGGVMDPSTTDANVQAAKDAQGILSRYVKGDTDKITGKKITNAAASGAVKMVNGFKFAEFVKTNIIAPLKTLEKTITSSNTNPEVSKDETQ